MRLQGIKNNQQIVVAKEFWKMRSSTFFLAHEMSFLKSVLLVLAIDPLFCQATVLAVADLFTHTKTSQVREIVRRHGLRSFFSQGF
jgi:phosphate starvation-inducible protein PhoH